MYILNIPLIEPIQLNYFLKLQLAYEKMTVYSGTLIFGIVWKKRLILKYIPWMLVGDENYL